jgi:hypothetical protein
MKQATPQPRTTLPMVRCAVYTRKSTEEGLEQAFNSLDAQREAGEAGIISEVVNNQLYAGGQLRGEQLQ